jgi:hypothetical protein
MGSALALLGADRREDRSRDGSWSVGALGRVAALGPTVGDLVLLADPRPHPELVEGRRPIRTLWRLERRLPRVSDTHGHEVTDVGPFSHSDGCDPFGLCDELSPCVAGGVYDGVAVFEDGV